MRKVELEIVADNSQYIRSTQEVASATEKMRDKVIEGQKKEKGAIEAIIDGMKQLEKARKKATDIDDIAQYNKKLAEARLELNQLKKAGLEVAKSTKEQTKEIDKQAKATNSLWDSIKKLGLAYLSVATAKKVFLGIMNATTTTADKLQQTIKGINSALGELSRTVATGNWAQLGQRLREAYRAGVDYAASLQAITERERQLLLEEEDRRAEMIELARVYRNTALVGEEGYKKRKEAAEEYIKLAEEGEKAAIELLELRLDAELDATRQILGYNKDISESEKQRVNEQIKANIRSAKAFDENKKQIEQYRKLLNDLRIAQEGEAKFEYVGEVTVEVGRTFDEKKIQSIKDAIAAIPEEVRNMGDAFIEWGDVTVEQRDRIGKAMLDIQKKHNEVAQSTVRASVMAELAEKGLASSEEKIIDDREKKLEEFIKATAALYAEYEKSVIEGLSGEERIRAERDFQLREIDALEAHLGELGELTEEHYKWLQALRDRASLEAEVAIRKQQQAEIDGWQEVYDRGTKSRLEFYKYREELDLQTAELAGELTGKKRLEIEQKWLKARLDLIKDSQQPQLRQEAELLDLQVKLIDKKLSELSLWDKLGIDDEGKKALKQAADTVKNVLDDIFDARLEDARRIRELYDTQVAEVQRALDTETRLMEQGFANNVDARRKELDELKKVREQALREEEKALKAKRTMDTISQLSSLVTASAEIFKSLSSLGPVGVAIAVGTIGTMFGAFAAAKTKAAQATKLEKGGTGTTTGMITGRRHSQGGERFLDHVEVERGEMFGVLNRRASQKYGRQFVEIVNNFNKDTITIDRNKAVNNIVVDVNQTNSRLDKVEYQLIKLNRLMSEKVDVQEFSDRRVEKRGNKTRIIRK